MNITIATGAQGRYELFEFICGYYQRLKKIYPFDFCISCSEKQTFDIARKYGHTSITVPNQPLYKKMNASVHAPLIWEGNTPLTDYVILTGSDDILSPATLLHYVKQFEKGYDYIYNMDCYCFDTIGKRTMLWKGYDKPYNELLPCGVGKALSRNILNKLGWQPYMEGYDRVLDTGMDRNIAKHKCSKFSYSLLETGLCWLDIKGSNNMTPFELWDNTELIDTDAFLTKHFPEDKEAILKLQS